MSKNGKKNALGKNQKKEVIKIVNRKIDAAVSDKTVRYVYNSNIGTAGVVLPAALLTKGTEQWQRIGTFIRGKKIHLTGSLRGDSTPAAMRVIVGLYKTARGVLPTVADVLQSYNNAGAVSNSIRADYNPENRTDFIIFDDKTYTLSGFAGTSRLAAGTSIQTADSFPQSKQVWIDKWYKCHHKTSYYYNANAGTIADVEEGLPFVLVISDNNTNLPTYDLSIKYTFEDA